MSNKVFNSRLQPLHDFEANWIKAGNNNFIPLEGEEILYMAETDNSPLPVGRTYRIPYNRRKIGDGKRNVNELPFEEEEQFIPIENPDVFVFDESTMTWNINPIGSFVLTKDYEGNELPGDDDEMHTCKYYKGDILRGTQTSAFEDGQPLGYKQTIYHKWAEFEHYRTVVRNVRAEWNITCDFPKATEGYPSQLVGIGKIDNTFVGGITQLTYRAADDVIEHYAKNHFVAYDKSQSLTETQKTQARNNIGAISVEISETLKDGEILVYDATSNKLVNSGFTFETLFDKIHKMIDDYMNTSITNEPNDAGGVTQSVEAPVDAITTSANDAGGETLNIGG